MATSPGGALVAVGAEDPLPPRRDPIDEPPDGCDASVQPVEAVAVVRFELGPVLAAGLPEQLGQHHLGHEADALGLDPLGHGQPVAAGLVATSTFRIVFAQRLRQLALLRAVGAGRGSITRAQSCTVTMRRV